MVVDAVESIFLLTRHVVPTEHFRYRMCSPYNVFFTLSLVMQCVCLSPKPTCILYTHTRGAACDAKLKSMFSRMRRRLKTEPQPLNPKP